MRYLIIIIHQNKVYLTLKMKHKYLLIITLMLLISACEETSEATKPLVAGVDASVQTVQAHRQIQNYLNFEDRTDFSNSERGFIAALDDLNIVDSAGKTIYNLAPYAFINDQQKAPETVNPSLWRQSQLLLKHGLYKVQDGIYQVRGYDLSNITFISGKTGWIAVDPLISKRNRPQHL